MKTHQLIQGSPEWLAYRAQHFNASDAPAMMGCSPYKTRTQLLHEMHTGLAPEVDAATQRRFDDGHRFEALARPLAEAIIGEDLYPVTGSEGKLSASFDGLTMAEDTAFEHKSLNDDLRGCMRDQGNGCSLPLQYQVQMEQQLMVSGAERVLFMASKWAGEALVEELHCWYASDPKLRAEIVAGWAQFEIDLAAYTSPAEAAPSPTGRAPETLPALLITVRGEVTDSNLASFKEVALAAIRSVNRDLQNDQDFADAEKAVKWCDDIEKRVAGAKQHALSQTATIDSLFKTMDDISAEARQVRLDLEKLVKARKVSLKTEMLTEAQTALADHIRALNTRLGRDYMPQVSVDFAGAITSKRNFDSMRAALDATLANAKIAANATADKIDANLKVLREQAADFKFLFADTAQIVLKAADDLQTLVKARIDAHKAAELQKEEETRARIRKEEKEKLERDQREAQEAEDALIASIWGNANRIEFDSVPYIQKAISYFESGSNLSQDPRPRVAAAFNEARHQMKTKLNTAMAREAAEAQKRADDAAAAAAKAAEQMADAPVVAQVPANTPAAAAPAVNVVPMRAAAAPVPAPATPPTLKLGQIGVRLGFSLTGEFLKNLGFEPAARDKSALLFHEADFPLICMRLVAHIQTVQAKAAA